MKHLLTLPRKHSIIAFIVLILLIAQVFLLMRLVQTQVITLPISQIDIGNIKIISGQEIMLCSGIDANVCQAKHGISVSMVSNSSSSEILRFTFPIASPQNK